MIWILIIAAIILLDQAVKWVIIQNFAIGGYTTVIRGFFEITHWRNTGAAWGILQNGKWLFIPMTIVVSAVMVYLIFKSKKRVLKLSLSFIVGGAVGNLIDRMFRIGVIDYLRVYIGKYEFPTFNIADSFIVIGTGILAYYLLFMYDEKKGGIL